MMRNFLWPILLLAVAACSAVPPPTVVAEMPAPRPGPAQGIDMATDSRDVSNELAGSGLDFVARYYRQPTSRWPALTAHEAATLTAAGKSVVAVWESHSHRPEYFSYGTGYNDALSAHRQAKEVGQPAGTAIYFAVDYNAPSSDIMGPIDQYFRGIAAGLAAAGGGAPQYRVGVYGSGAVCAYIKEARLAQLAWLSNSTAWRGYANFEDWNIRQGKRTQMLSFSHDWNEARDDYGGFQVPSPGSALAQPGQELPAPSQFTSL